MRQQLSGLERVLATLDPRAPLERGYAFVTDAKGNVVRSRDVAMRAVRLSVAFADGEATVAPVRPKARSRADPAAEAKPGGSGQTDLFS